MISIPKETALAGGSHPVRSSLGHLPGARWEFDEVVTTVFSDMLKRSIPQYASMRETVLEVGTSFVRPGTCIVDLGCSLGDAIEPFLEKFAQENRFIGIECSIPMLVACKERFQREIADGTIEILSGDLRYDYPQVPASLTLCILTLMFTPIEHRYRILSHAFENTIPRGALIVVEKLLGRDARLNDLFTSAYYSHKHAMGYTTQEIECKKSSLEGVLVPVSAAMNEELLYGAGFRHIECFWRSLNFAGWIAIKE